MFSKSEENQPVNKLESSEKSVSVIAYPIKLESLDLETKRHSFAHIMAAAVEQHFRQQARSKKPKFDKQFFEQLQLHAKEDNRGLCVDGLILNEKGQIFVQLRSPNRRLYPNCWDLLGGHVDEGEDILDTLKREIREESGFEVTEVVDFIGSYDYDIKQEAQKEGDNPHKRNVAFIVKVKDYSNPKLEEGKVSEYKWLKPEEVEILTDNHKLHGSEDYIYKTIKKAFENSLQTLSTKSQSQNFKVRASEEKDYEQMTKIKHEAWLEIALEPFNIRAEQLDEQWIQKNNDGWQKHEQLVAVDNQNTVLGHVTLGSDGEIHGLFVSRKARGMGVGKLLMMAAIPEMYKRFGEIKLGCLITNKNALSFYKKIGFEKVGERTISVKLIKDGGEYFGDEEILIIPADKADAIIKADQSEKQPINIQFGVGPVIENGCYYDFVLPRNFVPDDLKSIEKIIRKMLSQDLRFERREVDLDEAIKQFSEAGQPLKVELLENLRDKGTTKLDEESKELFDPNQEIPTISIYSIIDNQNGKVIFEDLCRGPHISSTKQLEGLGFKLDKFSASYWRGDQARGINMQRLYGLVYDTQTQLGEFLNQREEAKKRDHRLLGEQLDLFTFSELVGKGLPLFTPNGTWLRENLNRLSQDLRIKIGFQRVSIPHIAKQALYEKSGHWAKFGDEWLTVTSQESSDKLVMKPMNCPHHQQIYASKPRSYRDLPLKYLETTTVYRDEKAGEMLGLSRVRSITQDDSHIFCREDQIEQVYSELITIVKYFYAELGIRLKVRLSFRDPNKLDKYLGEESTWDKAESILRELTIKYDLDYFEGPGEAAFYGPKLDFMGIDALGREWQLATPQLDFIQPKRFELTYVDEDGNHKTPVMIHFALMGSIERFLSVYIEHTAGKFPFWLAPEQIRILTINDQVLDYVEQIKSVLGEVVLMNPLKYNELRYTVDARSESLGKKIREAKLQKIPLLMVIGEKDVEANQVSIEYKGESTKVGLGELKVWLVNIK